MNVCSLVPTLLSGGNLCVCSRCLLYMTLFSRYFHELPLPECRTKIIEKKDSTFPLFPLPNPNSTVFWSGKEFMTIPSVSLLTLLSHSVFPFLFRTRVRSLASLWQNICIYFFSCCFFFFPSFTECNFVPIWLFRNFFLLLFLYISTIIGRGKSLINFILPSVDRISNFVFKFKRL